MRLLLPLMLCCCLPAAETWLMLADDHTEDLLQAVAKASSSFMREAGIRCKVDRERGGTVAQLREELDKQVLRYEPDKLVIALGANDVWDFREEAATARTVEQVVTDLTAVLDALADQKATILLATPPAFGEDWPQVRTTMEPQATAIRS